MSQSQFGSKVTASSGSSKASPSRSNPSPSRSNPSPMRSNPSPSRSNPSPSRSNPSLSRSFEDYAYAASFGVSSSDLEGIATEISNCQDSAIEVKVEEAITELLAVDPVVFKSYRKISSFSLSYFLFLILLGLSWPS